MDSAQRAKDTENLAMACTGVAKAVSEFREVLTHGGGPAATDVLIHGLWREIDERQQRMQALVSDEEIKRRVDRGDVHRVLRRLLWRPAAPRCLDMGARLCGNIASDAGTEKGAQDAVDHAFAAHERSHAAGG
jgi:hypothetical protein